MKQSTQPTNLYFWFLTIIHQVFTKFLGWEKATIVCILCIYIFLPFWLVFFTHIDRRWVVLQSVTFCISYRLGQPSILLMILSVLFLIIPWALTITGTVAVLRSHIFLVSFSKSLYLFILLYSLTAMLLSVDTDILIKRHVFFLF